MRYALCREAKRKAQSKAHDIRYALGEAREEPRVPLLADGKLALFFFLIVLGFDGVPVKVGVAVARGLSFRASRTFCSE